MTSPTWSFDLLVLGSGPAGVSAAAAYAAAGGPGTVAVLSADPDQPYMRPPLSKTVLAGEDPPAVTPILDDEHALDGVELLLGTSVVALDTAARRVRTDDGAELGYERLVLATGAHPAAFDVAEDGAPVFTLRSLEHARTLVAALDAARSAVVVGSGFIGCEAAASLAGRGLATTMVTPEPAPQAARLGDWAADRIAGWLRDELGVTLRTGVEVTAVSAAGEVSLDDGSTVRPDLVLAAVGVTREQPFLDAAGLALDEDRVVVDDRLRASVVGVWVAGDLAQAHHSVPGRPLVVEHWGDALAMGELAGRNAAAAAGGGEQEQWSQPPGFWSEIGSHTLKYSAWGDGFASAHVVEGGGDDADGAFTVWYADEAGEVVGVLTHERDEDYERGGELLARRAALAEALGDQEHHDG